MSAVVGTSTLRVDGAAKVTAAARYAAETDLSGVLYGGLVTSAVAAGRIAALDSFAAENLSGVLGVLDLRSAPKLNRVETFPRGPAGETVVPLQGDRVLYAGQPIGLVVARDLGLALMAASMVEVRYEVDEPAVMDRLLANGAGHQGPAGPAHRPGVHDLRFADGGGAEEPAEPIRRQFDEAHGDVDAAWAAASHRIEAVFDTAPTLPSAMELHATVAAWDGDRLEVSESTQWPLGVRFTLATMLGLPLENVHVRGGHYIGGGFGGKVLTYAHAVLTALAAKRFGTPVKTILTRDQVLVGTGFRPQARQRVRLAADAQGRLAAVEHEVVSQTSMSDRYLLPAAELSGILYATSALRTRHRMLPVNTMTPCTMRAPGEAPGLFAFEGAVDELCAAMGADPVAWRIANLAERHPSGKPFSSRELGECLREGAAAFGWREGPIAPHSRAEGDWLVGQGVAAAAYGSYRSQAGVRVVLRSDGTAEASSATSEIGNGVQTAMVQVLADALGLPLERVAFRFGDTDFPAAPPVGASRTTASIGPAVLAAARKAVRKLAALAVADPFSPLHARNADDFALDQGRLIARGANLSEPVRDILGRAGLEQVEAEGLAGPPELDEKAWRTLQSGVNTIRFPAMGHAAVFSWGAHFVEVAVHHRLGTVRVRRAGGRFAIGRVLNPLGARRQIEGGMVFGLGQALTEAASYDLTTGRSLSASLADYHVPVSADMPPGGFDVSFLGEADPEANELGAKSAGELGTAGFAAAVANAVFSAVGVRVRRLPITPDMLTHEARLCCAAAACPHQQGP